MNGKELGKEIRRRRRAEGLTQTELAARAGISQQHLSLLEADPEGAQLRTLRRVLESLELSLAVLPAAGEALRRRQEARKRMNQSEDAFPAWSNPQADLERVGEMAAFYRRLHGPQLAPPADDAVAAGREIRRRMALIGAR